MAGAFGQPATSGEFHLYVGGKDLLQNVPLDVAPITWSDEVGGSIPTMSFTVQDLTPWPADGQQVLKLGRRVRFTRNGVALFAGHIIDLQYAKTIKGRYVSVTVAGYDAWLDWKIVPRWNNKKDTVGTGKNKRVRYIGHDDVVVKRLVRARAGFVQVGRFVDRTTGSNNNQQLGKIAVQQATLRSTLEEIAEDANWDGITRRFYIDHNEELHWYKGIESGEEAPFGVTDQEYAALVTGHDEAVEYWPMAPGNPGLGRLGVLQMALTGSVGTGARIVPNHHAVASTLDGTSTIHAAVNAGNILTCSGGWAWEGWVAPSAMPGTAIVVTSLAGFNNGPQIAILSNGSVRLTNNNDATSAVTAAGQVAAGSAYHLVVGQKADGTDYVYINGDSKSLTGTVTLCGDAWARLYAAYDTTGFIGDVSQFAWYNGDGLSEAEALAHYRAGSSIIVEGLTTDHNAEDEYHRVYVVGANAKGSGWFGPIPNQRSEWEARAKHKFLVREKSNTDLKRRKAGRNWLKRREPVHSGYFTITDPVHAAGWKAGQVLSLTDAYLGDEGGPYDRKRFAVAAVRGQYGPEPSEVRIDIDFGTIRRSVLREMNR